MRSLQAYGWDPLRPIPAAKSVKEHFGARAGRGTTGTRVCPVCALQRTLRRQDAAGFTSKHPIVSSSDGLALSPIKPRKLIAEGLGTQALTEHSLRRNGAQFYARRGVPLSFVQVLGRWRSTSIERNVADASAEKASWAPLAAA